MKILWKLVTLYFQRVRIGIFLSLSTNSNIIGKPKINQPVMYVGNGSIAFDKGVELGYFPSPFFYNGNCHIEARTSRSNISIGNSVFINNNFTIISEESVVIKDNVLIGTNVEIYDSDFHGVQPSKRRGNQHESCPVVIEENVWVGSNVKILKGVNIGQNSVISNGAIVTKNIPANVIAGGIPAKVIKQLEHEELQAN